MADLKDLRNELTTSNNASGPIKSEPMRYRNIASIMTPEVFTINPESPLQEAAQLMGEKLDCDEI